MASVQKGIGNVLERAELEMEATLNNISHTRKATAIAQAILQAKELKFNKIIKHCEALNHQQAHI